jgi:flagellar basal body rod protein FlgC
MSSTPLRNVIGATHAYEANVGAGAIKSIPMKALKIGKGLERIINISA